MYCIKLGRSDDEFWCSTISKITTVIDIYADEQNMKNAALNNKEYTPKYFKITNINDSNVQTITSMSQIGM